MAVEQPASDDFDSGDISQSDDDAPNKDESASTPFHAPIIETQPPPFAKAQARNAY